MWRFQRNYYWEITNEQISAMNHPYGNQMAQPRANITPGVAEPDTTACPFPDDLELPNIVYIWETDDYILTEVFNIEEDGEDSELLFVTLSPEKTREWVWESGANKERGHKPSQVSFDYSLSLAKDMRCDGVYIAETDRKVYTK